ncbi:hypothetical protein OO010_04195 [Flavobacteriaceae bacterium KMM 6898]|nr:hypothetical protein [Flavobacteriaceae bacterium KMM 6898]
MASIDTLYTCHHKFRFLLEELSDESAAVLKKNRLLEEFQNELEVYCAVSISFFMDIAIEKQVDQFNLEVKNGEKIKRLLGELDPTTQDVIIWGVQILRLKEEVEKLLFQYEKSIGSNTYITSNS